MDICDVQSPILPLDGYIDRIINMTTYSTKKKFILAGRFGSQSFYCTHLDHHCARRICRFNFSEYFAKPVWNTVHVTKPML